MNLNVGRLFFDECLGRPAIERLAQLVAMGKGEKPELRHLLDMAPPGTFDEVWMPRLATESWTVITTDGGRTPNKKRGEKLPRLCARYAVTHVILSPAVHSRPSFEKLLTILSVWYELLELASDLSQRGNRFTLEPASGSRRGHGRLIARPISEHLLAQRDEYLKGRDQALSPLMPPSPDVSI